MGRHRWWGTAVLTWLSMVPVGVPAQPAESRDSPVARSLQEGQVETAEVLWRGVPSRELLEAALQSREKRVRIAGALRAGETESTWAVDLLREMVSGRSPGVAMAARLALRQLGLQGGDRPLRSVVWPGADPDPVTRKRGRVEWTFLSRDGAIALRRHAEEALKDLGWVLERQLAPDEIPARCIDPWGGVFSRQTYRAILSVCGGGLPGRMAVLRVSVPAPQEEGAASRLGISIPRLDRP